MNTNKLLENLKKKIIEIEMLKGQDFLILPKYINKSRRKAKMISEIIESNGIKTNTIKTTNRI